MNQAFEKISEEKRQKIITACLQEFADKGYNNASTNNIVKNAEISKGLLFHYFGSKKNLYLHLLDIAIDIFIQRFYQYDENPSGDIFERLIARSAIKLKLTHEEPLMSKLVMEAFIDTPADMLPEIAARYQKIYKENMPIITQNIDFSLFREDIEPKKAIEFMMLFFDASYNKYVNQFKGKSLSVSDEAIDEMVKENYEFLEMMKFGMYKKSD